MPLYKLISGKHYMRDKRNQLGKCMVPGDTIECEEHELGGALNKFICVNPSPSKDLKKADGAELTIKQSRRNKNQYNVHHPVKGRLNDQPLTKEEAEEMVGGVLEDD